MPATAKIYLVEAILGKELEVKGLEKFIMGVKNMDLKFIADMYVPLVLVACLVLGYVVKKWVKDVDNKYIPTIVCLFGLVLNLFVTDFTIVAAVAGALTGLASTGMHQIFKQLVEGKKEA